LLLVDCINFAYQERLNKLLIKEEQDCLVEEQPMQEEGVVIEEEDLVEDLMEDPVEDLVEDLVEGNDNNLVVIIIINALKLTENLDFS
jgi:hypothetical protein